MFQTNVFKASLCACCKLHFPLGHHKKVNKYAGIFQNMNFSMQTQKYFTKYFNVKHFLSMDFVIPYTVHKFIDRK